MLELEEAVDRILQVLPPPVGEFVSPGLALGRVLAGTVRSPVDLPPFNNSAMDGYALRSADVAAAKADAPVRLRVMAKVAAGEALSKAIPEGGCVRLFTGSPLPPGADAVVMQEDTRLDPADASSVLILDSARAGENVRLQGEDVRQGSVLVDPGQRLGFAQVSLLAAAGLERIEVGARPRVGILATGSELREPGATLKPGQIYESNRVALAGLVHLAGGIPLVFPLIADTLAATKAALTEALETCDLLVTSGGASVGDLDFLKPAFEEVGGRLEFWKVAIKPGRPFVFGRCRDRFLFGLPGNPVSALVTFLLLVRPAVLRWQGAAAVQLLTHPAILDEAVANRGNRRHFIRVKVDEAGRLRSAGAQASHLLGSLSKANGLLDLAPEACLPAGTTVQVMRWDQ